MTAAPPKSEKDAREARRAAALRENLKRRRAQLRGKERAQAAGTQGPDDPESDGNG